MICLRNTTISGLSKSLLPYLMDDEYKKDVVFKIIVDQG